jgi:uncharacterized protein
MTAGMLSDAAFHKPAFRPLPLGTIKPEGWLRQQLRIQADGLSGHLHEFWPDIADSKWFGGSAEGWERAPYWLDGYLPLAVLLDDESLLSNAKERISYILDHQHEDGWLGPDDVEGDVWPLFIAAKVLLQYADAFNDTRAVDAVGRLLHRIDKWMGVHGLSAWAQLRWPELVHVTQQLYDRTGDPWLVEMASRTARFGYDWVTHFIEFPFREKSTRWDLDNHVVNNAMALKLGAILYRLSGDADDRLLAKTAIEQLDRWHGQAGGVFSGDESLAGLMPSQGTELCAVVEYLYSLEVLASTLGEPWIGDRLEKIGFNALPATFSPDMWSHQYDQQANQVVCAVSDDRVYTTNNADANIFGLEPNYGCCTANMHQGWPKFASHLWMETLGDHGDVGLAVIAYAPCRIHTEVHGVPVDVGVTTHYPFDDTIVLSVRVAEPVHMPLLLRIPEWCNNADVVYGATRETPEAGTYHRIDRTWERDTVLTLHLPMEPRVIERAHGIAVERGPLLYSLRIEEEWRRINEDVEGRELPHGDWEVHPVAPWNYALAVDRDDPGASLNFTERPVGDRPFSPEGAPVTVWARGKRLNGWELEHGAAACPPQSPVESENEMEDIALIPYGCTNLRITEFPQLDEEHHD